MDPVARPVALAYCRSGFEAEAATDLRRLAAHAAAAIETTPSAGSAFVVAEIRTGFGALLERTHPEPIFARSIIEGHGPIAIVGDSRGARPDRVQAIVEGIEQLASLAPWRSVWVEYPDTNEGKALSRLARAIETRLDGKLREQGWLREDAAHRLHVFLADGANAYIGCSNAATTRWPLGIPRLRRIPGAPSRSAAKLAEALVVFLGDREHELLQPGMRAVDLGAAPGGWTWVLARKGLRVEAVDNGPLKGDVALDPRVRHRRLDGMTFRPRHGVDWLTCDIVEQPIRVAELCAAWIAERAARRAIFNLKLPMKRRYDEVRRCEARIAQRLHGFRATLALRQLYHDREEVTGYLAGRD